MSFVELLVLSRNIQWLVLILKIIEVSGVASELVTSVIHHWAPVLCWDMQCLPFIVFVSVVKGWTCDVE